MTGPAQQLFMRVVPFTHMCVCAVHLDRKLMKDVPYFCFSHLIAKITVAAALPPGGMHWTAWHRARRS